jgi:hypothetical protein
MRSRTLVLGASALLSLAGCSLGTEICHDGIWLQVTPAQVQLKVGEEVQLTGRVEKCPDPIENPVLTLAVTDPSIVVVGQGAVLRGHSPGHTTVMVTTSGAGLQYLLEVDVVEP